MKQSSKLISVCFTAILLSLNSMADSPSPAEPSSRPHNERNFYVRGNLSIPTYRQFEDYSTSLKLGGNIAAGWKFHELASVEAELGNLSTCIKAKASRMGDKREVKAWTAMVNLMVQPKLIDNDKFKPFIGAGVGYSRNVVNASVNDLGFEIFPGKTSNNFAGQVFLGIEYALRHNISVLLDARWIELGKAPIQHVKTVVSNRLAMQVITVGAKFKF